LSKTRQAEEGPRDTQAHALCGYSRRSQGGRDSHPQAARQPQGRSHQPPGHPGLPEGAWKPPVSCRQAACPGRSSARSTP